MAFLDWSDELELGFAEIDSQHRWLVNATNALHDLLTRGKPDRAEVEKLLNGLVDYTLTHFVTEELLFHWHNYPGDEAHTKEHTDFVTAVREWQNRYKAGEEELSEEILEFLKQWLIHHIRGSDKAYSPYLKAHGVK
jgi:hemerythrin